MSLQIKKIIAGFLLGVMYFHQCFHTLQLLGPQVDVLTYLLLLLFLYVIIYLIEFESYYIKNLGHKIIAYSLRAAFTYIRYLVIKRSDPELFSDHNFTVASLSFGVTFKAVVFLAPEFMLKVIKAIRKDPFEETLKNAKKAEDDGDFKLAENLYREAKKMKPHDLAAYEKLIGMAKTRNNLRAELEIIKEAITAFDSIIKPKRSTNKKITKVNPLVKLTGFSKKKPDHAAFQKQLQKWKRRKSTIEKRLKKTTIK